MKKLTGLFLTLAMMCALLVPVSATADNYVFSILVDGNATTTATVGDTITVSLTLSDTSEGDTLAVYLFQDYLLYDAQQLKLVDGSIETPGGIAQASTHTFDDIHMTSDAIYVNRNGSSTLEIDNGATVVSFEMEVLETGTFTLTHHAIEAMDANSHTATNLTGTDGTVTAIPGGSTGGSYGGGFSGGSTTPTVDDPSTTDFETLIDTTDEGDAINLSDQDDDWVFTLYDLECMAEKRQTLVVEQDNALYSMRAYAVDTQAVWDALSVVDSKLVPVTVEVNSLNPSAVDVRYGNLIGNPWTFEVVATLNGDTSIMEVFSLYVHRTMEITQAEAEVITTALILEGDVQRHVPTNVYEKNGKWYACVSCHTNGGIFAFTDYTESFEDVASKWYEDTVLEMADRRIIYGVGQGLFEGERAVTRAEFAAILVRGLGFSDVGVANFPDVPNTAWCAGAVGRAYELGIIYGRANGNFDPNAAITREEAMAMIARATVIAEYDGVAGEPITGFSDVDAVSPWALDYVEYNISNGLIKGTNGMIRPTESISRAETATVMLRLLRISDLVDVRG